MKKIIVTSIILLLFASNNLIFGQSRPVKTEASSITVGYLNKFSTLNSGGYDWVNNSQIYDNGTNVGIGTTSPAEKLEINGNLKAAILRMTGNHFIFHSNDAVINWGGGSGSLYFRSLTTMGTYTTGYHDLAIIKYDGSFGIGTSSPTSILHTVASGAKTAAYTGNLLTNTTTSSTASIAKIGLDVESTGSWTGTSATNTGLVVNATGGTTNYAAIFSGGNVGIGNSSPASLLSIGSSSQFQVNSSGAISAATGITSSGNITFSALTANKVLLTTTGGQLTTGRVSVAQGGTGDSTLTGILKGNGTSAITAITGTTNYIPKWSSTSAISGASLIFDDGTNVGIGTASPSSKLEINGQIKITGGTPGINKVLTSDANGLASWSSISTAGGVTSSCTTVNCIPKMTSGTNIGCSQIFDDGTKVGIGTTVIPSNCKLGVNGTVKAKEFICTLDGWSDFVFENNYKLTPLSEVEQYINKNKHLPDIPSTDEVVTNGVAVGQTEALLLKKIEELTLYVIDLNKKNEELQKKMEQLEKSVK